MILFSLRLPLRRRSRVCVLVLLNGVAAVHEPGEDYLRLGARSARIEELLEVISWDESTAVARWIAQKASEIRTRGGPVSGQPRPHLRVLLELLMMAIHRIRLGFDGN